MSYGNLTSLLTEELYALGEYAGLFTVYSTTLKWFRLSILENRSLSLISNSCTINLPSCFVLVERLSRKNRNDMMCSKCISNSRDLHVGEAPLPQRVPVQCFCVWLQDLPSPPTGPLQTSGPRRDLLFRILPVPIRPNLAFTEIKKKNPQNPNLFSGLSMRTYFVWLENMLFGTG